MCPSREVLAGKFVGIYFGAQWDHDGQDFDRLLTELYHNVNGRDMIATFEIVYISSDRTAEEFQQGMRQRQFYSLPFDDLVRRKRLHQIFRAVHLPTFLLFAPSGERLTDDTSWVTQDPYGRMFPWRGKAGSRSNAGGCVIN
jgi:nucleoredoxin